MLKVGMPRGRVPDLSLWLARIALVVCAIGGLVAYVAYVVRRFA